MKPGMFSAVPISSSMRSTSSLAPPCSGPESAAIAAAVVTYGSASALPTVRIVVVLQFCSWSACRMNSTSSARASTGLAAYLGSDLRHSMFM